MHRLQSVDVALFRFINLTLSNPVFDRVMPFFSGNSFFVPLLIVLAAVLVWRESVRGRVCLVMVVLVICLGDPLILNTIKHGVGRLRPFNEIPDAVTRIGRGGSFSMPSSHSGNWFAAATVLFIYYRRSARFMLPLAATQITKVHPGLADVIIAITIVVPQVIVAVLSPWVGRSSDRWGRRPRPGILIERGRRGASRQPRGRSSAG